MISDRPCGWPDTDRCGDFLWEGRSSRDGSKVVFPWDFVVVVVVFELMCLAFRHLTGKQMNSGSVLLLLTFLLKNCGLLTLILSLCFLPPPAPPHN